MLPAFVFVLYTTKNMKEIIPELQKAIQAGYTEIFSFLDGHIVSVSNPEKMYPIIFCKERQPCPCLITRTVVYRIQTTDGLKGVIVLDLDRDDD